MGNDLSEFVHSEYFVIESAPIQSTQFRSVYEGGMFGLGSVNPTISGITVKTEIYVKPIGEETLPIPIKRLSFEGVASIRKGERIRAKIPRYRDNGNFFETGKSYLSSDQTTQRAELVDREYNEKEEAIEIEILDSSLNAIRIERSANYEKYFS